MTWGASLRWLDGLRRVFHREVALPRLELQRGRIQAVAQPRRLRAIGEDVAQVGVAAAANDLGPHHEMAFIGHERDAVVVERLPETRPAGAGLELGLRVEQRLTAADAGVCACFVVVPVFAAEGPFGPFAAGV